MHTRARFACWPYQLFKSVLILPSPIIEMLSEVNEVNMLLYSDLFILSGLQLSMQESYRFIQIHLFLLFLLETYFGRGPTMNLSASPL